MHYIRYIALFSLLCDCCYAHYYEDTLKTFLKAKEPINISNIVVDLVTNTPCIIDNWDNVKKYACRCALVKGAEYTTPDNRDGTLVIQRATEQGFCTDELLAQLRKDENLEDSADTDFINDLYYRSKVIKEIQISPDSDLYKTDKLTEQELKNMLAQAYNEKKSFIPHLQLKNALMLRISPHKAGCKPQRYLS